MDENTGGVSELREQTGPDSGSPDAERDYNETGADGKLTPRARALRAAKARRENRAARSGGGDAESENPTPAETEAFDRGGETLTVAAPQRSPQAVKDAKKRERPTPKAMDARGALIAATGTVEMLNMTGLMIAGPHALMLPDEKEGMVKPLARIYERNSQAAEMVGKFADPIALCMAAAGWGMRVYAARRGISFAPPAYDPTQDPEYQSYMAASQPQQPAAWQPSNGTAPDTDNTTILAALRGMELS